MKRVELNDTIAAKLLQMADLLQQQGYSSYRVAAYRRGEDTIQNLHRSVADLLDKDGLPALCALPGIGRGIGSAIQEMVITGRWGQLDRLLGSVEPELLFQTLPGIGPATAKLIHETLHVDTLEALETAAHDGRLEKVTGIGQRRAASIRANLNDRLGHYHIRRKSTLPPPSISVIHQADQEYRTRAAKGDLRRIAPKRFNPTGEAWLPVLHIKIEDWDFTLLYSNTQRAHELGKTNDWVVAYYHNEASPEGQCTIVTETRGPLAGSRIVRGREGECTSFYARREAQKSASEFNQTG